MFRKFSAWAITYAIKLGYISDDESEEYIYGFDLIMSIIFSDIAMLVLGMSMHMILETVIFVLMYKCIRKNTGGFHCEKALTCFISSCTMCICVLLSIKYFTYNFIIYIAATVVLLTILFFLSPIEAINKPLDEVEFKVFGRRARFVIIIVLVIYIVMCILDLTNIIKIMTISIADVTLFAILGKLKLLQYRKQHKK